MSRGLALAKPTDARARKIARRIAAWQDKFIAALSETPSVKHACIAARISRTQAYKHRIENAEFAARWLAAIGASVDELEAKAFKLAADGDANLIQFLLRCHRPEIYKETSRRELTGADGQPLAGKIVFLPAKAPGDE
jgi:hypothetical protein